MLKIHQIFFINLLLISWIAIADNIHFQINGLSGILEKNVKAQLSTINNDNKKVTLDRHYRVRVSDAVKAGLRSLGYYEPNVNLGSYPVKTKEEETLNIFISPGTPVLIGGTIITLRGGASKDYDYINLLQTCPKVGTVLNHGDYDHFKKSLINIAMRKGYFDSQFKKSQLGVSLDRHQAFWYIDYDSGERYHLGDVIFEGSQIRNEYLKNLIPFKKNDYYQSKYLSELNRRLSATGWYSSVVLVPEFDKARNTKIIPIYGKLLPSTQNTIETGMGYSTDVGFRLKLIWKKPWMNSYSHSLTTSLSISAPEQQLDYSYKIPLIKNPLEHYYLLSGNFRRTYIKYGAEQNSATILASRHWDISSGWQRAINLHWSLNNIIQENVTHSTTLIYPSMLISRTRSSVGPIPSWGDSQRYSIEYSNSAWGSAVNFSVLQTQHVWIRSIYDKNRFIIRGNLGWIQTNNFKDIPLNLRFFAGGDRSIRGYKYKSISPENEKEQLIGALRLVTSSLEYQYKISNKWWSAMFIDSGEAVNNIHVRNFKTGAGIGIRWQSPIGAIKIDCAAPICNNKDIYNLQFYIGLGPEL